MTPEERKAWDMLERAWLHIANYTDLLADNGAWDANMDARALICKVMGHVRQETVEL